MKSFGSRPFSARAALAVLASVAVGAILTLGLAVPASATSAGVNFTVDVTTKAGAPLSGVKVYAIQITDGHGLESDPQVEAKAVSKQAGFYSFTGASQLLAGTTYSLYFVPASASTSGSFAQLLGGTSEIDRAETFVAGTDAGQTTFLSASLSTNATISGVIKGSTAKVLKGATVDAYFFSGSDWYLQDEVTTSSKGAYALADLEPGSYKLEVYYPGQTHAPVYSGGAATFDSAKALSVALGSATIVNLQFPKYAGAISGGGIFDYYASNGAYVGTGYLSKAVPVAYPVTTDSYTGRAVTIDEDDAIFGARASSHGEWSIKGLAPGTYVVRLFPWYYNEPAQYFQDYGGSDSWAGAEVITVGSTTAYPGVAEFGATANGGAVKVTVTGPSNAPIVGAHVLLQRETDANEEYDGTTSANGTVTFGASGKYQVIRPGQFELSVVNPNGSTEPYDQPYTLKAGLHQLAVQLPSTSAQPGFSTPPSIAQTDTEIGTAYSVSATPARSGAQLSYQWYRDGKVIYGADSASYTSRAADLGTQLSVRIEADSFGFDNVYANASVQGVVTSNEDTPELVSPPVLSPTDGSTVHAGIVLSVSPGVWSVDGLTYAYQWFRGSEPIGNNSSHYRVTAADVGYAITASVSVSKTGYPGAGPVDAIGSVTPSDGPATAPTASMVVSTSTAGVPKGSKQFTINPGTWTGLDPAFSYQWYLGKTAVGTDSPSYVEAETKAALGLPLTVDVHASVATFQDGEAEATARTAPTALAAATQPVASDAGHPLTAADVVPYGQTIKVEDSDRGTWTSPSASDDSIGDLTYSYQWFRTVGKAAAKAIAGATASSYTPVASDLGDKIGFVETAHSSLWANGASVRIAAGSVAATTVLTDSPATVSVPTQEAPGVDIDSTITDDAWVSAGATVSYQWYQCLPSKCAPSAPTSKFTAIKGYTEYGFRSSKSQAGARTFVRVTAKKPGFATATVDSSVVTILANNVLVFNSPSDANGTPDAPVVGQEFQASGVGLDNSEEVEDAATYSTVVQACASDCLSPDATWTTGTGYEAVYGGSTIYVPTGADYANGNGYLRSFETVHEAGYTDISMALDPMKVQIGTVPDNGDEMYLNTYAGGDNTSTVFGVVAGSILHSSPAIQWYDGDTPVSGNRVTVENTSPTGDPEYAIVTYTIPGYTTYSKILVARYATMPTEPAPASNSVVGNTYGQTLSLTTPDPWADLTGYPGALWKVSYYWCEDMADCGESSASTYTPGTYVIGNSVDAHVRYVNPVFQGAFEQVVVMPGKLLPAQITDAAPTPTLSADGAMIPGNPITVSRPQFSPSSVVVSYQWQTSTDGSTWADIPGSTTDSFTPSLTDPGKQFRVKVTGTSNGYASVVEYSDAGTIQNGDIIREISAPTLSGDPSIGGGLTLDPGTWSHDVALSIQWLLNGNPIPGVTGTSYQPLQAEYGDEISARITASRAGQLDVVAESNRMTISQAAAPSNVSPPVITGAGTVTSPLAVSTGSWSVGGLRYTYQWSDASGPIAGATQSTLVLPAGDTVGQVSVTITATRSGYGNATIAVP